MHAFDILGDPVRRRILELLADAERSAGDVGAAVREEFGIFQPGVSRHLRVLRDNGFATVRAEGTRRLYSVDPTPLREVDEWLERYGRFWDQRFRFRPLYVSRKAAYVQRKGFAACRRIPPDYAQVGVSADRRRVPFSCPGRSRLPAALGLLSSRLTSLCDMVAPVRKAPSSFAP